MVTQGDSNEVKTIDKIVDDYALYAVIPAYACLPSFKVCIIYASNYSILAFDYNINSILPTFVDCLI